MGRINAASAMRCSARDAENILTKIKDATGTPKKIITKGTWTPKEIGNG